MMSDDMLDEDAENSACQDVDEIVIYVPEFSGYREVNIDTAISLCPTPTPARKESPDWNLEMRRRFEKLRRNKEEKRLLGEEKDFDEEDDVFDEGEGLQMRTFEPNSSHRLGEVSVSSILPRSTPLKKTRKHRRRRSGSFTGGVYPRKGHRNRSLLGHAIPPPNVHSADWRDMLAITDNKDDKLMKTMQAIKDALKKQQEAEMKLLGQRKLGVTRYLQSKGGDQASPTTTSTKLGGRGVDGDVDLSATQTQAQTLNSRSVGQPTTSGMSAEDRTHVDVSATANSAHLILPIPLFSQMKFTESNMSLNRHNWIKETFTRRECSRFIPSSRDLQKCGCGRTIEAHRSIPELTSEFLRQKRSVVALEQQRSISEVNDDSQTQNVFAKRGVNEKWSLRRHTVSLSTNAFGQVEFQGGPHPYKAQYVRVNFDTEPAYIMSLFEHVWQISPPRLIITVHGGTSNFDLQPKLARVFRKGLLKAASTTGAWIITSGCDTGVVKHVAAALEGAQSAQRNKIVCIGIAPWGLLKKREEFIGQDKTVAYYPNSSKGRFTALNNRHSYFLLVDNGTVGRYGAEVILRKRLEMYISQKQKIFGGARSVPVVCVVLEGGSCTIRSVLDYVTNVPRVPVVVCDGSGRAADLLAFAHQNVTEDGILPDDIRRQVLSLVETTFGCSEAAAHRLLHELIVCAQHKNLLTIFRLGEKGEHDVDHAILTALLKGQNLSASDQLALALAWNRVDIARSDVFAMGHEWPQAALHNAMMEALIHDRVDFVRLLLEQGINMQKFLTISRLDELYNTDKGPPNTLFYIVRDVVRVRPGYRYKLPDIGLVIEKLMGNSYKCSYTTQEFRDKYKQRMKRFKAAQKKVLGTFLARHSRGGSGLASRQSTEGLGGVVGGGSVPGVFGNSFGNQDLYMDPVNRSALSGSRALSNHILWRSAYRGNFPMNPMRPPNLSDSRDCASEFEEELSVTSASDGSQIEPDFRYPYSELMIWAVLTKRQDMAMCMWQHGEEAMAKALVACRLYKSLATEAAEDYLEVEICDELKKYAEEFRVLSLELLEHCYHVDDAQTLQLLTYELSNWSDETCLALAVIVNNKHFLAHPCCQILLADLWHGGLRMRTHSNFKVIIGLLVPPFILMLEFKTREELLNQPQTAAEHRNDMNYSSSTSNSSSSSSSSSSSDSSSFEDDEDENQRHEKKRTRKTSQGSVQSMTIANLFQSRRLKTKKLNKCDRETDASAGENGAKSHANGGLSAEYGTFGEQNGKSPPPPFLRGRSRYSSRHDRSDMSKTSSVNFGSDPNLAKIPKSNIASTDRPNPMEQFQGTRKLRLRRRFYEFYSAPVTTFWAWTVSYAFFIVLFTYTLLVKTPNDPTVIEYILIAYVGVFGLEQIRRVIMSDAKPYLEKIRTYFSSFWNWITIGAIILYIVGFCIRIGHRKEGRVILAVDSVLWTMKILDYLSVHPKLGPYVTMAGKMIQNMSYIIVMLVVTLLSFGLARQSITYPDEEWHWILVRNIFLKPYFMLYGEVYADEIDTCGDEAWDQHLENNMPIILGNGTTGNSCVPGYWIPPLLMTFFLLIANILLMSMLIAIFNHIFDATDEMSQQIWLFQRYKQVMEYESTPFLPPPFTILYHCLLLIQLARVKCNRKNAIERNPMFDFSLKLFLDGDQIEKLHDFEEDCMEDLSRQKLNEKNTSTEQRILRADIRTDQILNRLIDLQAKESMGRDVINDVEARLSSVEKSQNEILECVRLLLNQNMPTIGRCLSPAPESVTGTPGPMLLKLPGTDPILEEQDNDSAENTNSLPPGPIRRNRTQTICGGYVSEERNLMLLSPKPSDVSGIPQQRLLSVASMDPLPAPHAKLSTMSIRRRHEEYTSITDSIAVRNPERRLRNNRSNSSEHDESAVDSDGGNITLSSPRKRSTRDLRMTSSSQIEESTCRDQVYETDRPDHEEEDEAQADCELTDVITEEEDEEELEDDDEDEEDDHHGHHHHHHRHMHPIRKISDHRQNRQPSHTLETDLSDTEDIDHQKEIEMKGHPIIHQIINEEDGPSVAPHSTPVIASPSSSRATLSTEVKHDTS